MNRPPYNRKPAGPWRDAGDRKELLPHIDPNWRRRRAQREQPSGVWLPILLTLGVLAAVWFAKTRKPESMQIVPLPAAQAPSFDLERRARLQALAEENERVLQARAAMQSAAAAEGSSSINGRSIRRCRYQANESLQTEPCQAPWVEVSADSDTSRWQQVQEQEQMRLAAEAKLAEEQRRFAAAMGGNYSTTVVANVAAGSGPNSARCASAKAQRDEAYRIVGNNRSFDFIRSWQDIVYDACKS